MGGCAEACWSSPDSLVIDAVTEESRLQAVVEAVIQLCAADNVAEVAVIVHLTALLAAQEHAPPSDTHTCTHTSTQPDTMVAIVAASRSSVPVDECNGVTYFHVFDGSLWCECLVREMWVDGSEADEEGGGGGGGGGGLEVEGLTCVPLAIATLLVVTSSHPMRQLTSTFAPTWLIVLPSSHFHLERGGTHLLTVKWESTVG
ncbi:unnamed protein product [Hydatigera taeniaeformis]|uniref:Uncharacterized protein n=1 Tax=Hydatigena taeniaeformis TaxID=6205 RepID=A0A0R3X1N7_HYDTA|nr:unnamed protein product [Hydatigera taeniaeformis]